MKSALRALVFLVIIVAGFRTLTACSESPIGTPLTRPSEDSNGGDTPDPAGTWRSSLYPRDWVPGFSDSAGRFLQDFSYAGYHRSEEPIPQTPPGVVVDASQSPYGADPSGLQDSTNAIQAAIDHVASQGGGIVFLPSGTFRVKPQGTNRFALQINKSNVVLRGNGPDQTFIFNDETNMREKEVIRVAPDSTFNDQWRWPQDGSPTWYFSKDAKELDLDVQVVSVIGLTEGEYVALKTDSTPEWIAEHQMTGTWTPDHLGGLVYLRKVVAIDEVHKRVTLDAPIRYPLKTRDQARIFRPRPQLFEVGLENFSIGMKQVPLSSLDDQAYNTAGTVSYSVHQAHAIFFNFVVNGWIRNVNSFKPASNSDNIHILSNGIKLNMSRSVTVSNCHLAHVNYKGEGGNGYLFIHQGNDNLIVDSSAEDGRHNYDFSGLESQGNVILRSKATAGRLPSDFHMYLSAANLIDTMTLDQDYIGAVYRDAADHGQSTTQSVIWNTIGINSRSFAHGDLVETGQWGWGYVVGTSGKTHRVRIVSGHNTEPLDFVEGDGTGAKLYPPSLFDSQLEKRKKVPASFFKKASGN